MSVNCTHCAATFLVSDDDRAMLDVVSPVIAGEKHLLPSPTLCPACRQQRRLSWRNERNLYHRKCDRTGKQVVAMYPQESPYTVYAREEWWSDKWDPLSYGRELDFDRPFFAQYAELLRVVPRQNLFGKNTENCDYTNHCDGIKNCYMTICTAASEQVFFSKWVIGSQDIVDCYQVLDSSECYMSQHLENCRRCHWSELCKQCTDSVFLYDCIGCADCFLCWNLRHKQYCILNEQLTKDEYERRMRDIRTGSFAQMQELAARYRTMLREQAIFKCQHTEQSEDVSGDYIYQSKNVFHAFHTRNARDCRYCYDVDDIHDSMDVYEPAFDCELQYEGYACNRGKRLVSCAVCYDVDGIFYCDSCHNSGDLFGCIGVRNGRYCILNKQYTKEEYEELVPKLIAHMRDTGEWGEFFPSAMSPFAYNESVAQEYFPLGKEDVLSRGWSWLDDPETHEKYLGPSYDIPDDIRDVPDEITKRILHCATTGKPYKITPQELTFYREMALPVPRTCPDERNRERMSLRNPRTLWERRCAKCDKNMLTTYAPDRTETVYCEECYLSAVY